MEVKDIAEYEETDSRLARNTIAELHQEIERLVDSMEDLDREFSYYKYESKQEIDRLNNIIKEAREYIEKNQEEHKYTDRCGFTYTEGHFLRDSDTLLEILGSDKE